jgi:hypothetical protein
MNKLQSFFENNNGNLIDKWMHYFEVYDRHFQKYVGKEVNILEIGVFQGGSLQMWRDYFGPKAMIYGIDINPECKKFESDNIKIFIGSQEDRTFLAKVKAEIPKLDILIDDGGHTMNQQIVSFEELFDQISDDGVYLCEDLHTSYWPIYGGGYLNKKSFIEYSKQFIDQINAWHSITEKFQISPFTRTVHSLHYYDSILVIEKRKMSQPERKTTGSFSISLDTFIDNDPRKTVKQPFNFSNYFQRKLGFFFKK